MKYNQNVNRMDAISQRFTIFLAYFFGFLLARHAPMWSSFYKSVITSLIFIALVSVFKTYFYRRKMKKMLMNDLLYSGEKYIK